MLLARMLCAPVLAAGIDIDGARSPYSDCVTVSDPDPAEAPPAFPFQPVQRCNAALLVGAAAEAHVCSKHCTITTKRQNAIGPKFVAMDSTEHRRALCGIILLAAATCLRAFSVATRDVIDRDIAAMVSR
jgi:hypothetical protein